MTTSFSAPDISCGGCANAIHRALSGVAGVETVNVDVAKKTVTVRHEVPAASSETIRAALDHAGFPATELASPDTGAGGSGSCSCCQK